MFLDVNVMPCGKYFLTFRMTVGFKLFKKRGFDIFILKMEAVHC